MSYRRPQHQQIAAVLAAMDAKFLWNCQCFFGGGTAISMQLAEFRRSDDIDFLCADTDGYRRIRESVFAHELRELFPGGVDTLRAIRADQYGIRTILRSGEATIKFEIVREARIGLAGEDVPALPVTCVARDDLYAEKLLANADRYLDKASIHRDILDLLLMERRWGPIPPAAWAKAESAYGRSVHEAFARALQGLREDRVDFERCLQKLDVDDEAAEELRLALAGPGARAG